MRSPERKKGGLEKKYRVLKSPTLNFTFANLLASQRDHTIVVYKFMLILGVMEKGNFICVNQDQSLGDSRKGEFIGNYYC